MSAQNGYDVKCIYLDGGHGVSVTIRSFSVIFIFPSDANTGESFRHIKMITMDHYSV